LGGGGFLMIVDLIQYEASCQIVKLNFLQKMLAIKLSSAAHFDESGKKF